MRTMTTTILLLTALLLTACGDGGSGGDDANGRLNVVATTGQVADLVASVGGDRVTVTALMGPGVDPHLYRATAGDVDRLGKADVIFYNGLHLEAKMAEVLERLGSRKPTLAVAEAVPETDLLSPAEFEGAHDPHVWFDPRLWSHAADAVAAQLIELDPEHADGYRQRAAAYKQQLADLHAWAAAEFATVPETQRVLITAHDAFNYFGRAYGLEVRGLQGISTATEAGTGDVQDLAALIVERRIPALFVESSVSPRAIEAVREAVRSRGFDVTVGGEVYSDAMGDHGTDAGTYLGMIRHNVSTITAALRGEVEHDHEH